LSQPRVSGPVLSGSKEPSETTGDPDKQEILPGPPDLHNMSGRMPAPVALLLAMSPVFTASLRLKPVSRSPRDFQHPSWLSRCKSVYLDVGSNIGVQVMKLFEPERFPGADILGLFEEKFGHPKDRREKGERSGICALGFEPNPIHRAQLDKVQRDYQKNGWYVHFYPFAVGGTDSIVNFTVTESSPYEDWGARVVSEPQPKQPTRLTSLAASLVTEQPPQTQQRNVSVIQIDFLNFLNRELPGQAKVKLMKMDIEGSEWSTLAELLPANQLCNDHIEEAFIEPHNRGDISTWKGTRTFATLKKRLAKQSCKRRPTVMSVIDDESYLHGP